MLVWDMKKQFQIVGVDRQSGEDVRLEVDAETIANAKVKAELRGIVVTDVHEILQIDSSMAPTSEGKASVSPSLNRISDAVQDAAKSSNSRMVAPPPIEKLEPNPAASKPQIGGWLILLAIPMVLGPIHTIGVVFENVEVLKQTLAPSLRTFFLVQATIESIKFLFQLLGSV